MNVYYWLALVCGCLTAFFGYLGSDKGSRDTTEDLKRHIDERLVPNNQSPPTGSMDINGGSEHATSPELDIRINHSANATHFKISDEPNFLNRDWLPITDYTRFKTTKLGKHAIFIQFAANGFASSPASKFIDVYAPPHIDDVFIFKFNYESHEIGIGFGNQYIVGNRAYGTDRYILVMNINYPGHEVVSDVPTFAKQFHIRKWRYSFDAPIDHKDWIDVETTVWKGGSAPIPRYHFPVEPPLALGTHTLKVQVQSPSGTSNVLQKSFEAKFTPE